ncbi:hypothetical protein D7D25_08950 [Proteiniphilum sp. X52]|nr:hypothetical protein D7D25_08950 [Proteiniphilum sp. X52]
MLYFYNRKNEKPKTSLKIYMMRINFVYMFVLADIVSYFSLRSKYPHRFADNIAGFENISLLCTFICLFTIHHSKQV